MLTSYQMIFGQFRGKIADESKMLFIIKIVLSDLFKALFWSLHLVVGGELKRLMALKWPPIAVRAHGHEVSSTTRPLLTLPLHILYLDAKNWLLHERAFTIQTVHVPVQFNFCKSHILLHFVWTWITFQLRRLWNPVQMLIQNDNGRSFDVEAYKSAN